MQQSPAPERSHVRPRHQPRPPNPPVGKAVLPATTTTPSVVLLLLSPGTPVRPKPWPLHHQRMANVVHRNASPSSTPTGSGSGTRTNTAILPAARAGTRVGTDARPVRAASSAVGQIAGQRHHRIAVLAEGLGRGGGGDARGATSVMSANLGHVGAATAGGSRDRFRRAEEPADEPLEREPEVLGEERVDHRVDRRVAIAEPKQDRKERFVDAVFAERPDQVHREEGQPTQDEQAHDDGERFGRLRLHPEPLDLRLNVPLAHPFARPRRKQTPLPPVHRQVLLLLTLIALLPLPPSLVLRRPPEDLRRRVLLPPVRRVVDRVQQLAPLPDPTPTTPSRQVLRRRVRHGNLDLLVVLAAGRVPGQPLRRGTSDAGGGAVRASVAVRGLVQVRGGGGGRRRYGRRNRVGAVGAGSGTAAPVNAQREPVVVEAGAHACEGKK